VFLGDFFARAKKSPGRRSRTEALLFLDASGKVQDASTRRSKGKELDSRVRGNDE
jgi:hypothetical protein